MPKIKVLIAEDTPDILELLVDKVTFAGFEVATARDGEEALAKIHSETPDVILLDLLMPKKDGFTVLKQLRENPPSAKWQPVIIVSALDDLENLRKGFALEAEHYITKPFQPNDIIRAIQQMVKLIPQRNPADPKKGLYGIP